LEQQINNFVYKLQMQYLLCCVLCIGSVFAYSPPPDIRVEKILPITYLEILMSEPSPSPVVLSLYQIDPEASPVIESVEVYSTQHILDAEKENIHRMQDFYLSTQTCLYMFILEVCKLFTE